VTAGWRDLPALRLALARSAAWTLLLAGWVGLGSFAVVLAPGPEAAFALVALWLLLLGGAASLNALPAARAWPRRVGLILTAAVVIVGLTQAPRGGGLVALTLALVAWAALTAQASAVVRALRQRQAMRPGPPMGAAALGALCAAVALADLSDLQALALRLGGLVASAGVVLALLQPRIDAAASTRCRAGLFDCSLPAWPAGAWRDPLQWPTLLAGLAMLPMMAALPLMVGWCRGEGVAPQAVVALHLAAMFGPALLLQRVFIGWSVRTLSAVCTACLVAGAACVVSAEPPWNLLGLAIAHGAAWGLAWAGQLWAPERRSRADASPLRAAAGYAVLTLVFGAVVARFGAPGVAATHAALGLAAAAAWIVGRSSARTTHRSTAASPTPPSSAPAQRHS
jgi:hypothetical protein